MATFSFYANKHITTGEGGALLINDEQYIEKAMKMKNLDFDPKRRFQHDNLYWNYRLGGLQAALGISQTDNLEKTISKKAFFDSKLVLSINSDVDCFFIS